MENNNKCLKNKSDTIHTQISQRRDPNKILGHLYKMVKHGQMVNSVMIDDKLKFNNHAKNVLQKAEVAKYSLFPLLNS